MYLPLQTCQELTVFDDLFDNERRHARLQREFVLQIVVQVQHGTVHHLPGLLVAYSARH